MQLDPASLALVIEGVVKHMEGDRPKENLGLVPRLSKSVRRGEEERGPDISHVHMGKFYPDFGLTIFCPCIFHLQNVITRGVIIDNCVKSAVE